MLACTGVLRLLYYNGLILVKLLCESKCSGKRRIACGSLLKTLKRCESLRYIENLALIDRYISVHIAKGTCRTSRNVTAVGVCSKGNTEARVTRCERLLVEAYVGSHVKPLEVYARRNNLGIAACFYESACSTRKVAAACI